MSELKKDWMVWCLCISLFLAGGIYFNMLPEFIWKKEIGFSDLVGGASAIAAAVAAFAAWRSATISSNAAKDSRSFLRMQAYIMHRQQFEVLLNQVEKELSVSFKAKDSLYNDIFPNNRHLDREFSMRADGVELQAWVITFQKLLTQTNKYPAMERRELRTWLVETVTLNGNYLRLTYENESPSLMVEDIDTQITLDNPMRALKISSDVLNHFFVFGMIEKYLGMSTPPRWFYEGLDKYRLEEFISGR
ncbi:hypothetical protein QN412_02905 [Pseudomonas sp. RTB3]|uniref:hypothetical protein n=1 Tax=unclassified Pseudomonas TaxID=196821 RepID=UPI002B225779|nr:MULTISPECIES: hypothetical protein [unclassified Pseudomonas]MEB0008661.1 hypothetical protein [Pseudomonas sp. RTB2]MEB0015903.1 hypothetical protein [Pseudomonas sp. RTB3]MEB0270883.1 hypothetical protein [Pseudomonas sp. 5B4]